MFSYIFIVGLIIVLIALEYKNHDCIKGKKCRVSHTSPTSDMSDKEYIIEIKKMINVSMQHTYWRQSLICALIISIPILLLTRNFSSFEYLILVGLIFTGVYFSNSWTYTHFIAPNNERIERDLNSFILRI